MVFRLNEISPQTSALNFDGGSIKRAGDAVSGGVGGAVNALDGIAQKDAELYFETNLTEFNIGMNDELRNISGDSLGGVDYTKRAKQAYEARKKALYDNAGANPYKTIALDNYFRVAEPKAFADFENQERELSFDYSMFKHKTNLDNAKQVVGRTEFDRVRGIKQSLGFTESGNNHKATRQNKDGRVFSGKYQFGQARLNEFTKAAGIGPVDLEDFRKNPELQEAAMDWHISDILKFVDREGLNAYEGRKIKGVTVTPAGMVAVAHLGGKGGLKKFLESGGGYDPADEEGTKLSAYLQTHGKDAYGVSNYAGDPPDVFKNEDVKGRLSDSYAEIDAMDISANQKAKLKANAKSEIAQAALLRLGEENPPAALAALRSGQHDDELGYQFDNRLRNQLENQITREAQEQQRQFSAQATAQAADVIAWNDNGRQGQAPQSLTIDQYAALTPAARKKFDSAESVGDAVATAQTVDMANAGSFLASIAPSGEGYADEVAPFEAARKIVEERAKTELATKIVDTSLVTGLRPDMTDKEQAKIVDGRFAELIGNGAGASEIIDFVDSYNVAPKALGDMVEMALRGNDPAAKAQMVDIIGQLQDRDQHALSGINSPAVKRALQTYNWQRQGLTYEDAERLTSQSSDPANAGRRDARSKQWNKKSNEMQGTAWGMLQERIQDRNGMKAEIPDTVWEEYSGMVKAEFEVTGNMEVAVALAENAFFASHAATSIGGVTRFQKGAPEAMPQFRVYGDERDSAWIQEQAEAAAPGDGDVLELIPNGEVRRNKTPSYSIMYRDDDGVIQIHDTPFTPNPTSERMAVNTFDKGVEAANRELATARFALRDLQKEQLRLYEKWHNAETREEYDAILVEQEAIQSKIADAEITHREGASKLQSISDEFMNRDKLPSFDGAAATKAQKRLGLGSEQDSLGLNGLPDDVRRDVDDALREYYGN